jgi:excisionase family DNA binding protein
MSDEPRLLLRIDEAARLLGLGRSKAYELVAAGELPAVRIGRARRIPVASLEQFVAQRIAEQAVDRPVDRPVDRHVQGQ